MGSKGSQKKIKKVDFAFGYQGAYLLVYQGAGAVDGARRSACVSLGVDILVFPCGSCGVYFRRWRLFH